MVSEDARIYLNSINTLLAAKQLPLCAVNMAITCLGGLPIRAFNNNFLWGIRPPIRLASVTFCPLNKQVNTDQYRDQIRTMLTEWQPVATPEWTGIDKCIASFDKNIVSPPESTHTDKPARFALFKLSQPGPLPLYPPRSLRVVGDHLENIMISVDSITGSDWKQERIQNGIRLSPGGPTDHCLLSQRRGNLPLQVQSSTVPVKIYSSAIWNGLSILRFSRKVKPDDRIEITTQNGHCPDIESNIHIFVESNRPTKTSDHHWTVISPNGSSSVARRISFRHSIVYPGLPISGGHAGAIKYLLRETLGQAPLSIKRLACLHNNRFTPALELSWSEDIDTRELHQPATHLLSTDLPFVRIYHKTTKEKTG